ncbi:hypothetical protein BH18ACT10_BH18ACT10_00780 [soil metagenome]
MYRNVYVALHSEQDFGLGCEAGTDANVFG